MSTAFCPQCGSPRTGQLRYCATCGYDFWKAAGQTQPPPSPTVATGAAAAVAAESPPKGRSPAEYIVIALIVLAVVGGIGYLLLQNRASEILDQVNNELGGATGNVPPAGQMWFGSSFDPDTLSLVDRKTTVGRTEAFAAVAHLPRTMDGSQLAIRVYYEGELVENTGANAEGAGDLWGWSLGPLFAAGDWGYEVTDVGGNVLASGSIRAR